MTQRDWDQKEPTPMVPEKEDEKTNETNKWNNVTIFRMVPR